ncbi:MAG: hypothetical protein ACO35E_01425 [Ilumatobacteraceae bacterium]
MARDERSRDDLIAELINLLAGPVSSGVRAVGQANQRRMELTEHLEQACTELRRLVDVTRRMVDLLDEAEAPLRAAVPQIARLAEVLGGVLDEAPDDLGRRLSHLLGSLERLGEGLGPLLVMAQGAASMFGASRPAAPAAAAARPSATGAGAATRSAPPNAGTSPSRTSPTRKTAAKRSPARTTPAKKTPARKTPATKAASRRSRTA